MRRVNTICGLLAVAALGPSCLAQPTRSTLDGFTPPSMAPGSPAGSFALSGFDTIHPGSRKLSFSLPLRTTRGRGDVSIPIELPIGIDWSVRSSPVCIETQQNVGCVRWRQSYTTTANWWNEASSMSLRYLPALVKLRTSADDTYTPSTSGGYILATRAGVTNATVTASLGDRTEMEFRDALTSGKEDYTVDNSIANGLPVGFSRGRVFMSVGGEAATFWSDTAISDVTNGGSGVFDVNGWLFLKNGTRLRIVNGRATDWIDTNGNKATLTYNAGRLTQIRNSNAYTTAIAYTAPPQGGDGCTGMQDVIQYAGRNGVTHSIVVNFGLLGSRLRSGFSIKTYDQLFPNPPAMGNDDQWGFSTTTQFNPCVVSGVVLPNGLKYEFQYNSHGLLAKVALPTGGTFEYDYSMELRLAGNTQPYNVHVLPRVTQKRIYRDDSATLDSTIDFTSPDCKTGEVKHTQNATVLQWTRHHYLADDDSGSRATMFPAWEKLREWKTEELDGNGTVARTVTKNWEQRPVDSTFNGETFAGEDPVTAGKRMHDPRVLDETTTWASTNEVAKKVYLYDRYNQAVETKEYDYGQGVAGNLIRRTATQYVTSAYEGLGASANATAHIRDLVKSEEISESVSGAPVLARTEWYYDGTTESSSTRVAPTANGGAAQRWTAFGTGWTTRGNLTKMRRLEQSGGSSYISAAGSYDLNGNLLTRKDWRGNTTSYNYGDASGITTCPAPTTLTYAHVTMVTLPSADGGVMTEKYCWDSAIGAPLQKQDANGQSETYGYETDGSGLDRLASITRADLGVTQFGYCDGASGCGMFGLSVPGRSVAMQQSLLNGVNLRGYTRYDGLGREAERRRVGGQEIVTLKEWDGMGREAGTSLPHYAGESPAFVRSSYDALGRMTQKRNESDFGVVRWTHGARDVVVEDEARTGIVTGLVYGEKKRERRDARGRLIEVVEDDGGANVKTAYRYNALDQLVGVCQGGTFDQDGVCSGAQMRSFVHDAVGRLLTAANPESGTTQWTYDANGNALTKTDADGTVTTLTYDALNRVKTKSYGGARSGNATKLCYDGRIWNGSACTTASPAIANAKMRLTEAWTAGSSTRMLGFDAAGRVTASRQTTGGVSYDFPSYSYTQTGDLTAMTLPSGRVVSWTYDALGRRTGASWAKGTETYRTAAADGFDAGGGVLALYLGQKAQERWTYNAARKQVTEIRLGVTGDTAKDGLWKWEYCPMVGSARVCSANNGNVMEHEIGVGPAGGETQAFSYDRANRLVAAAAGTWSETYGMDALGNLWRAGRTGLPALLDAPSDATWYANGRNRAVPPGAAESTYFDAAGNRKVVAGRTLTYDAEGRVVASAGAGTASYVFDGLGRRVKTDVGGVATTLVYDAMGKLAAEYGPAATEGGVRFVTVDALGSTRALTDAAGTVTWRRDYAPYGEELATANRAGAAYSNAGTRRRFTGKERDAETGLDYFGARYLSAAQGRWTSPDEFPGGAVNPLTGGQVGQPGPLPYADITNPQSLNKYAYVLNNPLRWTDPDGHCPWCAVAGAFAGAAAQAVADVATGQEITLRKEVAAAVGGAIVGGTAGLASELGLAVQVAIVGSSGVVGGITERTIKTGDPNKAMENPAELLTDFGTNALGHGINKAAESVVRKVAGGAVATLSGQAERARTTSRQAKVGERLEKAQTILEKKQRAASAATDVTRDMVLRRQQQKKPCAETGGCKH